MLDDLINDLNGGFQGAGMGTTMLGGMGSAGVFGKAADGSALAANPWIAGGILAGGTLLGALGANDPNKTRAMRLNNRLGQQEADMGDLDLQAAKNNQALEQQRRQAWDRFGNMFSGYLSAMSQAKPTGMNGFTASLGGP